MKIRRRQIQRDADEHTRAQPIPLAQFRVRKRARRRLQHQQLLRQHLLEFLRRNAKPINGDGHLLEVETRHRRRTHHAATHAKRRPLRRRLDRRAAAEHALLKFPQVAPRPHARLHPDNRNRRGLTRRVRRRHLRHPRARHLRRDRHIFLDQHVRVDATETKRAHRRAPRHIIRAPRPRLCRGQNLKRAFRQRNFIRRLREIRHRRQRLVPQREQHLDESRRARAREQMPDVRLHRAERALPHAPARLAPQPPQTLELHRVAHRRPRCVALDEIDALRRPARLRVRGLHRAQLPLGTRREQIPLDVVGKPDATNQTVNAIARRLRVRESFQNQNPRAFANHETVAARVERRATPRRRQRAQLRKTHLRVERIGPRQTARQHRVRAPREQFVARELQRVERRRARRVERERAFAQTQRPRQHARGQPRDVTVQWVRGIFLRHRRAPFPAAIGEQFLLKRGQQNFLGERGNTFRRQRDVADDHAHALAIHRRCFRVAPRLPPRVQQQMKHGIELRQQIRGKVEARGVQREALDETRARRVNLVRRGAARIEHILGPQTPAARRNFARGVAGGSQIFPKRVERGRTRKNAADPDDRDGLRKLHPKIRVKPRMDTDKHGWQSVFISSVGSPSG